MIKNFEHNDVQSGWTGLLRCILVSESRYDLTLQGAPRTKKPRE